MFSILTLNTDLMPFRSWGKLSFSNAEFLFLFFTIKEPASTELSGCLQFFRRAFSIGQVANFIELPKQLILLSMKSLALWDQFGTQIQIAFLCEAPNNWLGPTAKSSILWNFVSNVVLNKEDISCCETEHWSVSSFPVLYVIIGLVVLITTGREILSGTGHLTETSS